MATKKPAAPSGPRPKLKLTGRDGNAFFILGRARSAGNRAGWPESKWLEFEREATGGDYDHLLRTCTKWFDVS